LAARPDDKVELPILLIRELIEHLSLKPARGGRKVAIVDDADDLSDEAANAFLKTLEEPPSGSVLILIGGRSPDRQFPTILSRCQVVSFGPLSNEQVASYLREHGVSDTAQLERLVRIGGGSIGQALALNDPALWQFRQTLLAALAKESLDSFGLATQWNQFDEDAGKEGAARRRRASLVLTLQLGLLQDALRISQGIPPLVAGPEDVESLRKLATRLGPDRLIAWIDRAMDADVQIDRLVQLDLVVEAYADSLAR
jgi:DNA polymerase-3 subunit delta'